jgi:hypothetical protein
MFPDPTLENQRSFSIEETSDAELKYNIICNNCFLFYELNPSSKKSWHQYISKWINLLIFTGKYNLRAPLIWLKFNKLNNTYRSMQPQHRKPERITQQQTITKNYIGFYPGKSTLAKWSEFRCLRHQSPRNAAPHDGKELNIRRSPLINKCLKSWDSIHTVPEQIVAQEGIWMILPRQKRKLEQ